MGCYYPHSVDVLDDLHLHRSQEQLSSWKHFDPQVCTSQPATYRSDRQFLATSSSLRVSTSHLPRQLTSTKAISIIVLVHFKSSQLFLFSKRCDGTFRLCGNRVTRSPFHIVELHAHKRLSAIWLHLFHLRAISLFSPFFLEKYFYCICF